VPSIHGGQQKKLGRRSSRLDWGSRQARLKLIRGRDHHRYITIERQLTDCAVKDTLASVKK
jgi:hypothetical protein